ncbi:hypothetical protein ABN028_24335 [Actinopolymorpha sp. B17G11]|uniref:hypothetical protein n=1 Tax=Actinopolymorpha sp. B17G11 TaxID=3160861 RepID=UPI0032E389AA
MTITRAPIDNGDDLDGQFHQLAIGEVLRADLHCVHTCGDHLAKWLALHRL